MSPGNETFARFGDWLLKSVTVIAGVVAGMVLGVLLIVAGETWLLTLRPPPETWSYARAQAYPVWLDSLQFRHLAMLLGTWFMGGGAGGLLAAAVARHPAPGWLCGLALAVSAILLTSLTPHPFWLAAMMILAPLAGSIGGSHIAGIATLSTQP